MAAQSTFRRLLKSIPAAPFAMACAIPALADEPSCSDLHDIWATAQASFKDQAHSIHVFRGGRCAITQELGSGPARYCQWPFSFRDPAASEWLRALRSDVENCFNVQALPNAGRVNHPDTFEHNQYLLDGAVLSLSLKDKAALRKTFVFLRMSGSRH